MMTEAEQDKWQAVLQDCVRHCNNGEPPLGTRSWERGYVDYVLCGDT